MEALHFYRASQMASIFQADGRGPPETIFASRAAPVIKVMESFISLTAKRLLRPCRILPLMFSSGPRSEHSMVTALLSPFPPLAVPVPRSCRRSGPISLVDVGMIDSGEGTLGDFHTSFCEVGPDRSRSNDFCKMGLPFPALLHH